MIERLQLENFTAFTKLDISFSPGINVFIGENGTGKTHILKILYSFFSSEKDLSWAPIFYNKTLNNFMPYPKQWGTLLKKGNNASNLRVDIFYNGTHHTIHYDEKRSPSPGPYQMGNDLTVINEKPVYIPVKEMMANAPGFNSLYNEREVHFEEVYSDIVLKAYLPKKREITTPYTELCKKLEYYLGGNVFIQDEHFYIHGKKFDLEFSLLAEGLRKLGLLWILLQNGSLDHGSVLFWDEPETNMNPSLVKVIVEVLLELQRMGVHIFIATHSYLILKQFDIQKTAESQICFFLFAREKNDVSVRSGENYQDIIPNKISEAYTDIYNKEIQRSFGGKD